MDLTKDDMNTDKHPDVLEAGVVRRSVEVMRLRKHLAWALDEISGGDYESTPRHECEFRTNPEKGHCDFCWGFWAAVGVAFPERFTHDGVE